MIARAALSLALGLAACAADAADTATPACDAAALRAAPERAAPAALADCLASPDPAVRDALAFSILQRRMRAGDWAADDLRALRDRLSAMLDAPDPDGVARPFAALALSEVARTDRIAPWMTDDERAAMAARAAGFLSSVRDYRGFSDRDGWRHGVAHGADWALQLALNPALDHAGLAALRDAIATQAVPSAGHAYVFGEPERLARPLLVMAQRDAFDAASWTAWFAALGARLGDPALAWKDEAWLARRHDLAMLLYVLRANAGGERPGIVALRAGIDEALKTLP